MRGMVLALMAVVVPATGAAEPLSVAASACTICHGPGGHSAGGVPSLAGRPPEDLLRALAGFRDGSRPATIMDRIVRGYDDAQLAAIVAEYSHVQRRGAKP